MSESLLHRSTFATSRLLEFFTEEELTMQIGCHRDSWPLALVKELIDNGLDACESAGRAPEITVTVGADRFCVRDTGPGLPQDTLARSLNYLVRVSDKSHYVSPSRGQLGNALKCLWAAPYVVSGETGRVDVSTGGLTHTVDVTLDRIAQQPQLTRTIVEDGFVKIGTLMTVYWPEVASYLVDTAGADFYNACLKLCHRYAAFNPHASFVCQQEGGEASRFPATDPEWRKWLPRYPTSPHWYTPERLRALIAAYLGKERHGGSARTVREFVSEFDGLKGTAKQKAVTDAAGLSGAFLRDLVRDDDIAIEPVETLLSAMQTESRPVKPAALGVLGEGHLKESLVRDYGVEEESLKYKKVQGVTDGIPYILEVACGQFVEEKSDRPGAQIIGVNWTPALKDVFPPLPALLGNARVFDYDPVAVLVHLATPSPLFGNV
jgi:DNA topoisomerase VI subunit B